MTFNMIILNWAFVGLYEVKQHNCQHDFILPTLND